VSRFRLQPRILRKRDRRYTRYGFDPARVRDCVRVGDRFRAGPGYGVRSPGSGCANATK